MGKWIFKTRKGLAEIVQRRGGSFTLLFDGQALEEHSSQTAAADALANGTCYWPSFGDLPVSAFPRILTTGPLSHE